MLYVNPQAQPGFKAMELSPGAKGRETEALKEFEQLFLYQMLKEMRKTVPDYGLHGSGGQKEYFEEMMDDFLAGEMAASGQLGVAKQLAEQLHARENAAAKFTGSDVSDADRRLAPGGIWVREEREGISMVRDSMEGIKLKARDAGFPVNRAQDAGIPLSRAHESYRANQEPQFSGD